MIIKHVSFTRLLGKINHSSHVPVLKCWKTIERKIKFEVKLADLCKPGRSQVITIGRNHYTIQMSVIPRSNICGYMKTVMVQQYGTAINLILQAA